MTRSEAKYRESRAKILAACYVFTVVAVVLFYI